MIKKASATKMTKVFDCCAGLYDPLMKLTGTYRRHLNAVMSIGKPCNSDKVLSIGGGTGLIASGISPYVEKVTILDPSDGMLKKARAKSIDCSQGFAQVLPFNSGSYTLIECTDALHHFSNGYLDKDSTIEACIKEWLRVTTDDSRMIVIEINPRTIGGRLVEFLENRVLNMGSRFFPPDELDDLFRKHACRTEMHKISSYTYALKVTKS